MKILLVGARSAVAQVLAPSLGALGDVVTAGPEGCEVPLDLEGPLQKFRLPQGTDIVVNTAASFGTGGFASLADGIAVNVLGSLKLCEASLAAGVKHFVQISSINATLRADSPYYDAYALTKRQGDEAIELRCRGASMVLTILRPSQLYGHPMFRRRQLFVYSAMDKAMRGEDVLIHGRRAPLRNYLHARDLSRFVSAVIEKRVAGCYQCTHPSDASFEDVARAAIEAAKSKSRVQLDVSKSNIADNVFPFDPALYKALGMSPLTSLHDGVAESVQSMMLPQ